DGLVMDYEVECPKHSGAFDYRTGAAKRLPPCINLRTYPAKVEAGEVMVEVG
ncbi:MAG: Rieske family ferredoxin, partial [Mesorhizobium sp.]